MSAFKSLRQRFRPSQAANKKRRRKSFLSQGEQLEVRQVLTAAVDVVSAGELAGMQQLYAVDNDQFDFDDNYTVDNSGSIASGSFDRVAYYVELGSEWVWVSMDTFDADPTMLGIPQAGTNIVENGTRVNDLNIESNHPNVTAATGQEGIIEFWASDYNANGSGAFGSDDGRFDWKDSGGTTGGGHGSFQVFAFNNAGLTSANTLFGITANGGSGIGDQPTGEPDWTFGPDTGSYGIRNLEVWVGNSNAAPTITDLEGDSLNYTPGVDGAAVIDQAPAASAADPMPVGANGWDGGNLTVSISSGGVAADDSLSVLSEGSAAGEIDLAAGTVSYEGTAIGTATGGTGGADLVITFNNDASTAAVSALLDNITYENPNGSTSSLTRTTDFTLTDGDGATSDPSTVAISMNIGGPVDTFVWDGTGDGVSFANANNWVGDTAVPDANDIAIFRNDDSGPIDIGGSRTVGEIRFDGTGNYTLENGTIITNTIDQQATATGSNTISAQLTTTLLSGSVAAGELNLTNLSNAASLTGGTWTLTGGTLAVPTNGSNTGLGATAVEVELDGGTLDVDGVPNTVSNALGHFGYHINNDALALDLNNNGGMMGGGSPTSFQQFFGQALLTGPLDFDGDAQFQATGAIGPSQNDNYSNLFLGTLAVDAANAGDWTFDFNQDDDRVGFWIDLDQDGIFESDTPGLSDNNGEQITWDDGTQRTVNLAAGDYRVAFTHREGGGGSKIKMDINSPGLAAEQTLDPSASAQDGFWSFTTVSSGTLGNNITVSADSTLNVNAPQVDFGSLTFTDPGLQLTNSTDTGGSKTTFTSVSLAGDATVNMQDSASLELSNITENSLANVTLQGEGNTSLATDNSFTGQLRVQDDVNADIVSTGALGSGDNTDATGTFVSDNATLTFSGGLTFNNERFTLSGKGTGDTGALHSGGGGNNDIRTEIILTADATISNSSNTLYLSGGIATGGNEIELKSLSSNIQLRDNGITGTGGVRTTGGSDLYFHNNADNTYDGDTIVEDNTRLRVRRDSSLGNDVGVTIIRDQGTVMFEDGDDTYTEDFFIEGNGRNNDEGAFWNNNGTNTIEGTVTLTDDALIRSDNQALVIEGQVTGGFTLGKSGPSIATLANPANDFANANPTAGILRLLDPEALGAVTDLTLDSGATLEYFGDHTVNSANTLQSLTFTGGQLNASGGTTSFDLPINLPDAASIRFGGDGQLNIEQAFGNGSAAIVTDDALNQFGYHTGNVGLALDLNQNLGMLGGGDPRNGPSFFGQALLTNGPDDRGLDFNNDNDFINTGAIGQNDQFSNLFIGFVHVSAANEGDWEFRRVNDDDTMGIWLDLDQDGVFESDTPGLSSDNGEQLQYDNDSGVKTVNLLEGTYMFAVTQRENGGGSGVDVEFAHPNMTSRTTIKPSNAAQAGLWSTLQLAPNNNVFRADTGTVYLNAANTFDGNVTIEGGTVVANNAGSLGATTGEVIVQSGGSLALDGGITVSEPLTLDGPGAAGQSAALTNLGDTNTYDGPITVTDSSLGTVSLSSEAGELTVTSDIDTRFSQLALGGDGELLLTGDLSNLNTSQFLPRFNAYLFTGNDTDLPGDGSQIATSSGTGEVYFAQESESLGFWGDDLLGVGNGGNPTDPNNWGGTYIGELVIPGMGTQDIMLRSSSADDANRIRIDLNRNGAFEGGAEDPYGQDRGGTFTTGTISVPQGVPVPLAFQAREGGGGSRIQPEISFDGGSSWHRFDTAGIDPGGIDAGFGLTFDAAEQTTKSGNGTVTLSGDNSGLTGPITIDGGMLVADGSANGVASLGAAGGGITIDDGGALGLANFGDLSSALDDISIGNGSLVNVAGDNTVSTNLTVLDRSLGTVGIESLEAGSTFTIDSDIELEFSSLAASGAGDTVINGTISGDNADRTDITPLIPGLTVGINQLYQFGYHDNPESDQDLSGNGGLLSGGDPTTHPDFQGVGTFTDGPTGEGLDYDNVNDFNAAPADIQDAGAPGIISQGSNYSSLWYGQLTVDTDDAGNWDFDIGRSDDRAGIWIDLDQNGIFEPTTFGNPNGGNNQNGELITYEDGNTKTVNLSEGIYRVAFTFKENSGNENLDISVKSPTMGSIEDVNTLSPAQDGYWSTQTTIVLEASNQLLKTGAGTLTLTADNSYQDGTELSAGTLLAANGGGSATGPAAVNVTGTGVLGGDGAVTGAVNVSGGGAITSGDGLDAGDAANLTTGDLDVTGTGISAGEIIASGNDTLEVTGSVTLTDAELQVSLADDFRPSNGTEFILIANDAADTINGTVIDPATSTNLIEGDTFEITHQVDGVSRTRQFTLSYTGGDGNDLSITIVNRAPISVADGPFTTTEDTPFVSGTVSVLDNDSDADNDDLTVTAVDGMSLGSTITLASGASLDMNADGTFTYTPVAQFAGTDSFTYTVSDGELTTTVAATVTLNITAVADTPTLAVAPASGGENTAIALDIDVSTADTDGSESLDVSIAGIPVGNTVTYNDGTSQSFTATAGDTTLTLTGTSQGILDTLAITQQNGLNPAVPFDLTVSATTTEASNSDSASAAPATLTVTVDNTPPAAGITGPASSVPGLSVSFTFTADDPNPNDTPFTYEINWGDGTMQTVTGTATLTLDHAFTSFSPSGPLTVTLDVTDVDGETGTATHSIDVVPVAMIDGNLVAGGTSMSDRIIFYPSNVGIRVRYNNTTYPRDTFDGFSLGAGGKLTAMGEAGNDQIIVAGGLLADADFHGGDGNDYLAGGTLDDTLVGGSGNDIILGGEGDNFLVGDDRELSMTGGNDRLEGRSGRDIIFGGGGTDRLNGNAGDDTLDGGDGNDFLFGGHDNDLLTGGAGVDTINGYFGNDIVLGGDAADQLFGSAGRDLLIGNNDADRLKGDSGNDTLIGGNTDLDDTIQAALDALLTNDTAFTSGLEASLNDWFDNADRTDFGTPTADGESDDLTGGPGVDAFQLAGNSIRDFRSDDTSF